MAQTKDGAIKLSAGYYGLSIAEYLEKIKKNSYCNKCKKWKSKSEFGKDNSRPNGLYQKCKVCRWRNGGVRGKPFVKGCKSPMKDKHFTGEALDNIRKAVVTSNKKRIGLKKIYSKEGYANLIKAVSRPYPHLQGEKIHFNPNSTRNIEKKKKGIPLKY